MYSGCAAAEYGSRSNRPVDTGKDGGIPGRPPGYRACVGFGAPLSAHVVPRQFRVLHEIDDDSFFTSQLREDPFKSLGSKDYVFIRRSDDGWGTKQPMAWTGGTKWSATICRTQTFIARVSLFRTPEFTRFGTILSEIDFYGIELETLCRTRQCWRCLFKGGLPNSNRFRTHNSNDYAGYPPKKWQCPARATSAAAPGHLVE